MDGLLACRMEDDEWMDASVDNFLNCIDCMERCGIDRME